MKRAKRTISNGDLLPDYDFSKGTRGKYAKRFAQGTNIVVLEPDVAKAFPNAKSVNEALRAVLKLVELQNNSTAS